MSETPATPTATDHSLAEPSWAPGTTAADSSRRRAIRYGIGVTATVLGGYLLLAGSDVSQLLNAIIVTNADIGLMLLGLSRVAFAVLVVTAGIAILPGGARTWIGAAIALVGTTVAVFVSIARVSGGIRLDGPFWFVVLTPPTLGLLSVTAGWLFARGRHPLSYLLLLLAFVPALISYASGLAGLPYATTALLVTPTIAVIGIGIAWVAAAISRSTSPSLESELG